MMKNYKKLLAASLCLSCGLMASAFPVKFEWNIPGAAEIKTGSYLTGEVVGPASADDTSFTYECSGPTWIYLVATDGYKITDADVYGSKMNPGLYDGKIYVGKFVTDPGEFNVTLAGIERSSEITVDVVNGADYIKAVFNDGYKLNLRNGVNHVAYDPDLETSLTLSPYSGPKDFYSITLNGTPMKSINAWNPMYEIKPLKEGDEVRVRVFEGEEPPVEEYTVNVGYAPGMEDCIVSIYNSSLSVFYDASELPLTVRSGNTLRFNFNTDDYNYERFILNGRNVTGNFSGGSLLVTVDSDTQLVIEGYPKVFPEVDYTAYVMNPEGVLFYLGGYRKNPHELTDGEPIGETITLPATGSSDVMELTPEDTRKFTVSVGGRIPNLFIAPLEGWYIETVQGEYDGEQEELTYVTSETQVFYVVARRFDDFRTMNVDVRGDAKLVLNGSSVKSNLWDNPAFAYSLTEGEQTVEFLPGYNLPFSLRSIGEVDNMGVFLDGVALTADENGVYSFTPWYPEEGEVQSVESTVTVVCDGSPARTSRVRLELEDDMEATVYYSAVRHELPAAGRLLLAGTEVIVKPAMADCTIRVNDEVVYGLDADDKFVGALNGEGEYIFEAPTGTATITVSEGCGFTGVSSVGDDASLSAPVIYTIDGRRLPSGASPAPGLYIVNGRKTNKTKSN